MPKSNICIIGLSKLLTDEVCRELSLSLEMFYANVDELLEYEIMDKIKMEELCGREYLLKEETSIINRVCTFDNTIINLNYSNLLNESVKNSIKDTSLVVYLCLSKDRFIREMDRDKIGYEAKILNLDLFSDRNYICKTLSDINILCGDLDVVEIMKLVENEILKLYA